MLKAKMAGTGVGGNSVPSKVQGTIRCVLCSTHALQAGAAQPPEKPVCSPTPHLLIQLLGTQFVLKPQLPEGKCWGDLSRTEVGKGSEMSELPSSHRKHGIEENELQGAGEVLFFLLSFSTSLNLWLPLLTAQHLQKSIRTKRILFPRECNCCWWLTGLLRLQTYRDLSAGEVRAANSAKYSHSQGWRLVKMQNTAFDIILLYPKLRNLCCQKSGCHPACLLKPREEIKPKEMIQGSACILFSTVAFQLEEGTRPH